MVTTTAQAADSLGTYRGDGRATMLSYSLPFSGTPKTDDKAAFALSVAGNAEARINTGFEIDSLTLNGVLLRALNDRLKANGEDDTLMPLIVLGVVVGGAILVVNQDDDSEREGCPEGTTPTDSGNCSGIGDDF